MTDFMPKVALLGDINMDVFLDVPLYPAPGGDTHVYEMSVRSGGSVSNTAVALSRLGTAAELIGCTGRDAWGDAALAALQREAIDLTHVQRHEGAGTGLIFVAVTPDGERTMFSYRGANALLDGQRITEAVFESVDWLHLSGYAFLRPPQSAAAWRAAQLARQLGIPLSLDLGVEPTRAMGADLPRLLSMLDLLVLSDAEAESLTGSADLSRAVEILLDGGVKSIGMKLGRQGCLAADRSLSVRIPILEVEAVDTTGAGDAFSAGMIYAALAGLGLGARALLGNAYGALAATCRGGGAAVPGRDALADLLRAQRFADAEMRAWAEECLTALGGMAGFTGPR